jgi:hypothetical protein
VSDAVADRRFSHRQRFFELGWAVINARQNVAMQIHHTVRELLAASYESSRAPGGFPEVECRGAACGNAGCALKLPAGTLGACLLSCSVLAMYRNALCLAGTSAIVSAHAGNLLY